jgi:(1->4)-alpha-D-glucan 1-alpha-D-glucosylmutase
VEQLLDSIEDGRSKMFVVWRTLNVRRANAEIFRGGDYVPLPVQGPQAIHVCAFARRNNGKEALVVAPRWYAGLLPDDGNDPLAAVWEETFVDLSHVAEGVAYRNGFTGEIIRSEERSGLPVLPLKRALAHFPIALLLNDLKR